MNFREDHPSLYHDKYQVVAGRKEDKNIAQKKNETDITREVQTHNLKAGIRMNDVDNG